MLQVSYMFHMWGFLERRYVVQALYVYSDCTGLQNNVISLGKLQFKASVCEGLKILCCGVVLFRVVKACEGLPGRIWRVLTQLNILLPYDPTFVLLGIYPKELRTYIHTKTCT